MRLRFNTDPANLVLFVLGLGAIVIVLVGNAMGLREVRTAGFLVAGLLALGSGMAILRGRLAVPGATDRTTVRRQGWLAVAFGVLMVGANAADLLQLLFPR